MDKHRHLILSMPSEVPPIIPSARQHLPDVTTTGPGHRLPNIVRSFTNETTRATPHLGRRSPVVGTEDTDGLYIPSRLVGRPRSPTSGARGRPTDDHGTT